MKKMTMNVLLVLVVMIFVQANTAMAVVWWGNVSGDHRWDDGSNWWIGRAPLAGEEAGVTGDYAIVDASGATASITYVSFNGAGELHVVDGGVLTTELIVGVNAGDVGTLTISGGVVDNSGKDFHLGLNPGSTGILNISGGSLSVGNFFYLGQTSDAIVNMTGGDVDVSGILTFSNWGGNSELNLHGGTFSAEDLWMKENTLMDITEGTLVLNGDETSNIAYCVENGWISAYDVKYGEAGFGSTYDIAYQYDSNSGLTTVTAIPEPASLAILCFGCVGLLRKRK